MKTIHEEARETPHPRATDARSPGIRFPISEARGIKEKDFTLPRINGKAIDVDPPYAYRSPYLLSKVGSDVVTVKYGSRKWEYHFGKNEVRVVKE